MAKTYCEKKKKIMVDNPKFKCLKCEGSANKKKYLCKASKK